MYTLNVVTANYVLGKCIDSALYKTMCISFDFLKFRLQNNDILFHIY